MKKSDLKDNHIVEFKDEDLTTWRNIEKQDWNEDLTHVSYDDYDIMKVYEFDKLVWERKEKKTAKELFESGEKVWFIDPFGRKLSAQQSKSGSTLITETSPKHIDYFKNNNVLFHDDDDADFYFNVEVELKEFKNCEYNYYTIIKPENDNSYSIRGTNLSRVGIEKYNIEIKNWLENNQERHAKYMAMKEGTYAK